MLGTIPTAGALVAAPIYIYGAATFDKIGMEVSAIGSGASAFECLYDSTGTNGGPGALMAGGSTTSTSVTAVGDFALTFSSPVSLAAGLYFAASEFSWTTTAPTVDIAASVAPEAKWMPQGTVFATTTGAMPPIRPTI